MFEVKATTGNHKESGFLSYEEAARRAQELANEQNRSFSVIEPVLRCIIRPKEGNK